MSCSAPSQSIRCALRSTVSCSPTPMITPAAIPTGMLISNTQRQPTVVVIRPPIAGPMIADTPHTAENQPWILARRRGSKMSPAIVNEMGWTAPAPRPWSARKAMSSFIDVEKPHSAEPTTKTVRPNSITGLRPYESARRA